MTADRFNFRCWDIENKHMFYDGYNNWEYTHIKTHDFLALSLGGDIYRQFEYADSIHTLIDLTEKATDKYILMQSTCLTDKNGKEIYEGDILFAKEVLADIVKVEYSTEKARFTLSFISKDLKDEIMPGDEWDELAQEANNLEVIGNIYENKDILGE